MNEFLKKVKKKKEEEMYGLTKKLLITNLFLDIHLFYACWWCL